MLASHKTLTYKIFAAFVAVMVMLAALPVTPAFAATSGPNNAGTGTDNNAVGTVTWGIPGNITTSGTPYTTMSVGTSATTHYLQATNYGFAIPTGATINGITVFIRRQSNGITSPFLQDNIVKLVKAGTVVGSNLAATGTNWPNTAFAVATYGGSTNLWGTTWTPADINGANFGVVLSAVNPNASYSRTATVDYIQVTVTYTVLTATTTTVVTSGSPSTYGSAVTFTATVNQLAATGNVNFYDGATLLGSGALSTVGGQRQATYTTTATQLTAGAHANITATYVGDSAYATSTSSAITQTVNQKALTVTGITASNKTYTGTTAATINTAGATLNGVLAADTANVTLSTVGATGAFTPNGNVGNGKTVQIAGLTISGSASGNYSLTQPTTTANITTATLTYTATPASRAYGAANPGFSGNVTGFVNGETQLTATTGTLTFTSTAIATSNVGSYPINGSGLTANNGNYTFVQAVGNTTALTITSAPLTITASSSTMTYGGSVPTITPNYSGFVNGDTAASLTTAPTCSTTATSSSPVNTYPSSCSGAVDANYTISYIPGSVSVTAVGLTITASSGTMTYGGSVPTITPIYAGLQGSDTAPSTPPTCSTTATNTSPVGPYPSTCSGAADPNYSISYSPGSVSVTTASLTITAQTNTKTYDGTISAVAVPLVSGLQNTDTVTGLAETYDNKNVGIGKTLSVSAYTVNDGNGGANYTVATITNTTGVIDATALTITASSSSMTYGGSVPTVTPIYAGLQGSDTAPSTPPTCSTTATNASPAGSSYPSTCSGATDPNYSISYVDGTVTVVAAGQTITITTHAPSSANTGATFPVAATATSGLPVDITTTGSCSGSGSGSATIQMAGTVGTCTVHYNQAGDTNFSAAPEVTEDVSTMAITSADHTTFTVDTAGTFTVTTNGTPAPALTETGTLPAWLSFTDNGNGTATLAGTPPTGSMGTYPFIFKAHNGVATDVTQNFTLTVSGGPVIVTNGVNTASDTGDGHLDENEVVRIGITKFAVTFNQDLINVSSTDPNYGESVINPANFLLVNDNGNGFQTVDCKTGVDPQDFAITVDSVTYNNNGGAGPFVATLSVNSNNPLSNGSYRLYICGTTSITDLGGLKLAGNGTAEGTDFIRNFSVNQTHGGGGGNGNNTGYQGVYTVGLLGLIPVTGFAPGHSTLLPAQPADSAYSSYNDLRMEIPALGVNVPIVGVAYKNNNWDLTWLGKNAGYLDGSAYPTWSGNSVLTGHVVDAAGAPGPFAYIKDLQIGDEIKIHFGGQIFIYEVRENQQVLPTMLSTIFKHENYNWLTLVTCEDYNNTSKTYNYRRYARAVLVSVVPEK